MKYEQVIKHYGTVKIAAQKLGLTTQCIYNWQKTFPVKSQALVYLETKGKLQIDGAPKADRIKRGLK